MDWELVIVSNGKSQEAQLDAIKKFAQNDERVKVDTLFCYLTFSRKKVDFLS